MLYLDGTVIRLTRGDTAKVSVLITNSTGAGYQMQSGDVLKLTVKKSILDSTAAFSKTAVSGVFNIAPADTKSLDFGEYVYDVQLTTSSGDVYTIIPPSLFEVMPEVTV